jgi:hypothetical protein
MAATNTDKFTHVGSPGTATTLASPGHTIGGTGISVVSTANWPVDTGVFFAMDQVQVVNGVQQRVVGTYTEWEATVSSSTGIVSMVLKYGSDQNYPAGSTSRVYIPVSSSRENALVDGMLVDHTQLGRHAQLTDSNGNKVLGLTPVASAVDDVIIANAAAGGTPSIGVEGTDTDIPLQFFSKGKGGLKVKGRADGWNDLSGFGTFSYSANNSQKEYVATTPSDLSSFLQPGHRISFTRTVAPPTQSMAFTAASSQYATRASGSVTGITFTTAFTTEAWVFLNSYGAQRTIVSRDDATNGWCMDINPSGQVEAFFRSGAGFSLNNSAQSIPLKRWVHVAMTVTVATKTFTAYVNGVAYPMNAVSGTPVTTMTQGGALQVGADNANSFFDGQLSEVRVWSVAQSAASILSNMAISLTGSESNLVALFQGNGNFNDKTANANTLTATGGAIATQAANPYNAVEYGIITKVSSTQLTIFMGTDYNLPSSGGISSPQYSDRRTPMGFPGGKEKWVVDSIAKVIMQQGTAAANTWYNILAMQLQVPTGSWSVKYSGSLYATNTGGSSSGFATLSTSNSAEVDAEMTGRVIFTQATNNGAVGNAYRTKSFSVAALAAYYLLTKTDQTGGTTTLTWGPGSPPENTTIVAECGYL